jgi:hypothetical protein
VGLWLIRARIIAAFTALALWSTIHLTVRAFFYFKRYTGLYFWSLIITSWSLSIRAAGFLMKYDAPWVPWILSTFLGEVGWVGMVTGFSIVLWARLNIVVEDRRIRNGVLAMILTNGFIWHTALIILQFGLAGASASGANRDAWLRILNPFERTQITVFTVQEFIIFGFYIQATYRILHDRMFQQSDRTRKVMLTLFVVQTVEIMLDIIIITLDLAGYFTLKAIIHSWVYGIKLELEFVVLNQLKETAKSGVPGLISIPESDEEASATTSGQTSPATFSRMKSVGEKPDWWDNPKETAQTTQIPLPSPNQTGIDLQSPLKLEKIPENRILEQRTLTLNDIGVIPDPDAID